MKLSIIIVNWNTLKLTSETIASIYKETKDISFEVFVIDNNSSDGSAETIANNFPQVKLIENKGNLGFSKANNQGLATATGEYLMFLNSDTIIINGALNKLVKYLDDNQDVMMVGPKLLNKDGSFQFACRRQLPNPINSVIYLFGLNKFFKGHAYSYKRKDENPDISGPTEALSGAAMMFRREVYEKNGELDEDFFMYGEDLDFCKRVLDKNWKTIYFAESQIIHLGGESSKNRKKQSLINFYDSMWIYYKKHFYAKNNFVINFLVYFGIQIKKYYLLLIS